MPLKVNEYGVDVPIQQPLPTAPLPSPGMGGVPTPVAETPDAFLFVAPGNKRMLVPKASLAPDMVADFSSKIEKLRTASAAPKINVAQPPPLSNAMDNSAVSNVNLGPPSVPKPGPIIDPSAPATPVAPAQPARTPVFAGGSQGEERGQTLNLEDRYKNVEQAAQERSAAAVALSASEKQFQERKAEALQATNERILRQQEESNKRYQEKTAELDNQYKEIEGAINSFANERIEPDRLFQNKGTFAKIGAAISMGLGAFGAGMTGSRNYAMEIIQSAINNDIDAQKEALASKRSAVSGKLNLLGQMRDRLGDDRLAEAAARETLFKSVELNLEKLAALSNSEQAAAKATDLIGQIRNAKVSNQLLIDKLAIESAQKNKGPSQKQLQVQSFTNRMGNAEKNYQEALGGDYGSDVLPAIYNWIAPNFAETTKGQQYEQVVKEWALAFNRKDSGATIKDEEMEEAWNTYWPRPGDSKEVVKQKEAARARVMEGMRVEGGVTSQGQGLSTLRYE